MQQETVHTRCRDMTYKLVAKGCATIQHLMFYSENCHQILERCRFLNTFSLLLWKILPLRSQGSEPCSVPFWFMVVIQTTHLTLELCAARPQQSLCRAPEVTLSISFMDHFAKKYPWVCCSPDPPCDLRRSGGQNTHTHTHTHTHARV